jgi:putative ABC transport system permease protein
LKQLPNAQGLVVSADLRANLEATILETMSISLTVLILFAGVIAFGSIVNTSLVELADRIRDVSSLRVLGYRPNEISGIFFRQNMVTFAISLILAVPISYAMVLASARAYDTELFRMPVVFKTSTILFSAAISLVFVLFAQWVVHVQVRKLDWLEGVKTKE